MQGFDSWLESVGLLQYRSVFSEHRIDLDVLSDLTDHDLQQLGVPLGDRKRILKAVAALGDPGSRGTRTDSVKPTRAEDSAGTHAERRQVTIVFCDLVKSTELAGGLDPEELADVMTAYQECCGEVVAHWDGHLAEFLGDGAVVYFGWPSAHEDDAERAVHAALELTRAAGCLSAAGASLSARAGIATGLVVVGDIKSRVLTRREGAVGATPNLAARVQALAPPGAVAITPQTRKLIGDRFALEPIGQQTLKGISAPVEAWLVTGTLDGKSRFDARAGASLSTMVGREHEMATLLRGWQGCLSGSGRAVLITGEAGIGKSRLLRALVESTTAISHEHMALQCSPYHRNTALMPFIDWLKRSARIRLDTDGAAWVDAIEAYLRDLQFELQETVPLIAKLLSAPPDDRYEVPKLSPQLQRDRTIRLIIDIIRRAALANPVLMVIEDLHWADPTTLDLLSSLIDTLTDVPGFLVMTARPKLDSPFADGTIERIALGRLAPSSTLAIVEELAGRKRLPTAVLESVIASADGVPLFAEELTRSLLESGKLLDLGDRYELASASADLVVPATLHDLLVSRLDSLPSGKVVARVAATLGQSFSLRLLRLVVPSMADRLPNDLRQLCAAGILDVKRENGGDDTYAFRHALLREAAYQSQLKTRRRQVHLDVASVLEKNYSSVVEGEPEVLAHHYAEGGRPDVATEYLLRAGRKALQSSATREAIMHLSKGLKLIQTLPRSHLRDRTELGLQSTLGTAYMQARGWAAPEVEAAYFAAATLSEAAETVAEEIRILWGTWVYYQVRGRVDEAVAASERIQTRADRDSTAESLLVADMIGLQVGLYAGRFSQSQTRCKSFRQRYDAERHRPLTDLYSTDVELVCDVHEAIVLWILGQPDRATDLARHAERLAAAREHPYSIAWCRTWGGVVDLLTGDTQHLGASLQTSMAIAEEHGYAYVLAMGKTISGWLVGQRGDPADGAALMRAGLAEFRATGAEIANPFFETLEAELLVQQGQPAQAFELLARAKRQIDRWGERWQEAEVYRVEGNALATLASGCPPVAETSYRRAVEISMHQGAKGWQLRACTDFARALQRSGRPSEAKALLEPLVADFAGMRPTEDVKRARSVCASLTGYPDSGKSRNAESENV